MPMPASKKHVNGGVRRLPAGRQADLASFVAESGEVTVAMLAERYAVSTDTIRRDLDQLDADGILVRTHGGAISLGSLPRRDAGLNVRLHLQTSEKEEIGRLAAGLVHDRSVLIINAGTTALAVARNLRDHRELTIATNNLLLPSQISPEVFRDLYVFGGSVRTVTQATTGPVRFQAGPRATELDIQADLALIGVGGVSAEGGCSTSNLEEATMMADMISRASRVAILADSTKFDRRLFARIAGFDQVDHLVTDRQPDGQLAAALRDHDVEVLAPEA
jgi:DeoR family transcriptional regulator, fructose operon transcriptional repressor